MIVKERNRVVKLSLPWWSICILLAAILLLVSISSVAFGAVSIPFNEVVMSFFGKKIDETNQFILDMRVPRTIIAILVGAALAMSGGIFQSITRNHLASPDIIGVTGGAALAAVTCILLFPAAPSGVLPVFAFIGGAVAAAAVYFLSWRDGIEPTRLILMGIAMTALCVAIREAIVLKAPDEFESALYWLVGSVWGQGMERLADIWFWFIGLIGLGLFVGRPLSVLQLGDSVARGLGSRVELTRFTASAIGVGLAGCAVAIAGNIGFIGLIAPHMARVIVGSDARRLLPVAAFIGAIITLAADTIGRIIIMPTELPAGLLTSLIGAPYFLWLLSREKK
jgi:ABC-type Fe3+-siderophore transport system permease subunit